MYYSFALSPISTNLQRVGKGCAGKPKDRFGFWAWAAQLVAAVGCLPPGKASVATLSERFPRQSVAKSIDGMSHQHADAQNEGRSHNSSRKHERSPRFKSIKEDEHMHSQKHFGDRARFDRDRCALATATCLQHPERSHQARPHVIHMWQPSGYGRRMKMTRRRARVD